MEILSYFDEYILLNLIDDCILDICIEVHWLARVHLTNSIDSDIDTHISNVLPEVNEKIIKFVKDNNNSKSTGLLMFYTFRYIIITI